jgi:hypothetical protein
MDKIIKNIIGDVGKNYIRKLPGHKMWRVYSEKGRNMGTFPSPGLALRRLEQVEYFRNRK